MEQKYLKYKKKYLELKLRNGNDNDQYDGQFGGENSWNNKEAFKKLDQYVKLFGEPDIRVDKTDGIAIWLNKSLQGKDTGYGQNCFEEIIIRDELIKHKCPMEHYDFLYSYIKIQIYPPSKLSNVLSLSGSVGYDPLKQLLYARCASLEANIVTLKIATDIILDKDTTVTLPNSKIIKYRTINDVHIIDAYGQMISATNDRNAEDYLKKLYDNLCENISTITDQSKDNQIEGYWPAAFDYKDGKCFPPDKADKICANNDKADKPNEQEAADKVDKPNQKGAADKPNQKGAADKLYQKGAADKLYQKGAAADKADKSSQRGAADKLYKKDKSNNTINKIY